VHISNTLNICWDIYYGLGHYITYTGLVTFAYVVDGSYYPIMFRFNLAQLIHLIKLALYSVPLGLRLALELVLPISHFEVFIIVWLNLF